MKPHKATIHTKKSTSAFRHPTLWLYCWWQAREAAERRKQRATSDGFVDRAV
jgi:hypothetical protein